MNSLGALLLIAGVLAGPFAQRAFAAGSPVSAGPVASVTPAPPVPKEDSRRAPLSLDDCYAAALKRSENVATQAELIEQAEEKARQAKGGLLPSVSAIASRRWQQPVENGTGNAISPATQDLAHLNLSQPIFRGLREFAALRQAGALRAAALHLYRQAEILLYRDVAQAFYSVQSLERDLANVESQVGLFGQRVRELEERIRIGRSRVSEKLTIQASQAGLRSQIEALKGQLEVAREALAFQTGLPADVPLREEKAVASPGPPLPLERYLARIDERPDVQAGRSQVAAAEEGVSVAKGAHLPSLDLGGNLYLTRPGLLRDSHWDVTVGLSIPIYAGGILQSRVRESASQEAQAELALSRARRLAEQEIRALHATVSSGLKQLQALEDAARLSEGNYSQQSREYRLGLVTNIDVLQALITAQESRRALDRARYALRNDRERLDSSAALKPVPAK